MFCYLRIVRLKALLATKEYPWEKLFKNTQNITSQDGTRWQMCCMLETRNHESILLHKTAKRTDPSSGQRSSQFPENTTHKVPASNRMDRQMPRNSSLENCHCKHREDVETTPAHETETSLVLSFLRFFPWHVGTTRCDDAGRKNLTDGYAQQQTKSPWSRVLLIRQPEGRAFLDSPTHAFLDNWRRHPRAQPTRMFRLGSYFGTLDWTHASLAV